MKVGVGENKTLILTHLVHHQLDVMLKLVIGARRLDDELHGLRARALTERRRIDRESENARDIFQLMVHALDDLFLRAPSLTPGIEQGE